MIVFYTLLSLIAGGFSEDGGHWPKKTADFRSRSSIKHSRHYEWACCTTSTALPSYSAGASFIYI